MKNVFIGLLAVLSVSVSAQAGFSLALIPSNLTSVPKLHSGAYGVYKGKWFFIGGRKNGLHGFQPPFAFQTNYMNDQIYIVDPATDQSWSEDVYSLPDSIREPITSTNMEFYLQDSMLYMIGGYGWKDSLQNFVTWPTLTAINMNGLMDAVINNQAITPYFRQITDSVFAVCGSHVAKLDSTYYLVFGHRFDGTYDRSDTTGFFVQQYTNEIRKFQIADNGTNLWYYNYTAVRDTDNFHRRDYNLIPFYNHWFDSYGLTAYSGVFRKNANLPFFNCVDITDTSYRVRTDFNQNLSQYHSAVCALYDSANLTQHNLFFGGMSMYYLDSVNNTQHTDSMIPFVRTISDVVRNLDGDYFEFDAGIRMPALLGTNAYFFMDTATPIYKKFFVHLDALPAGHNLVGYITGGIESPEANINETDPSLSIASPRVFEVYIDKDTLASGFTPIDNSVLNFYCYPNPAHNAATVEFEITDPAMVKLELMDANGKLVEQVCNKQFAAGKQKLRLNISQYPSGVYNCVITLYGKRKSIRLAKD